MSSRLSAHARVTITVVVSVSSNWGPGVSVDQVHRQASEEAINKIRRLLEKSPDEIDRVVVKGTPLIEAIIVAREE